MSTIMRLWILRPAKERSEEDPWKPWYDKSFGFVIIAGSEAQARHLANENAGDENRNGLRPWLDPALSSCKELIPSGEARVVITAFRSA